MKAHTTKTLVFAFFFVVFCVTILLRFGLASVNQEANDNHMNVVHLIMTQGRLPGIADDWEGFQPKLYHWTFAQLFQLLHLTQQTQQIVFIQIANMLLGLGVLWMLWDMLKKTTFGDAGRRWAFVLIAANPSLLAIFGQCTNDGFVIFFCTLAVYAGLRYWQEGGIGFFGLMAAASVLAGLSKGNGLVAVAVLGLVMALSIARQWRAGNSRSAGIGVGLAIVWLILFLLIVPWCGQYIERYQQTGQLFPTNMTPEPLPSLFSHGEARRPGVVSFRRTYLTFPLANLLAQPNIGTDSNYPIHRTSLWAQLYGQMNYAQFAEWPESWEEHTPFLDWVARSAFVLALLPSILAAGRFLFLCFSIPWNLAHRKPVGLDIWLHTISIIAYLLFIFLYSWQMRDYDTMKPIFLFPAILSMGFFLASGLDWAFRVARILPLRGALHLALGCLTALYWLDIAALVFHLNHWPFPGG
jgi:hypothetical protein